MLWAMFCKFGPGACLVWHVNYAQSISVLDVVICISFHLVFTFAGFSAWSI